MAALVIFHGYQDLARTASAVINCSIDFAYFLFSKESNLHATYYDQIEGGVRAPAQLEHDRQRRAVDALLYGSYAGGIHFATLSVDGRGLRSYGPISIKLRDIAIASRATVLEENSYSFVERYGVRPGMGFPEGHMAPWPERDVIAVVKAEPLLLAATDPNLFSSFLLSSGADRKDDQFVEVHIYGSFSYRAAEKVSGPRTTSRRGERALLKALKELVVSQGTLWEDV